MIFIIIIFNLTVIVIKTYKILFVLLKFNITKRYINNHRVIVVKADGFTTFVELSAKTTTK